MYGLKYIFETCSDQGETQKTKLRWGFCWVLHRLENSEQPTLKIRCQVLGIQGSGKDSP